MYLPRGGDDQGRANQIYVIQGKPARSTCVNRNALRPHRPELIDERFAESHRDAIVVLATADLGGAASSSTPREGVPGLL